MGYTLPLEIQWQRFTELGVGEGSQREVQLHHLPGVSSPHSSSPALTWLIPSGSGPREDQWCQFPPHPHPRRARSIDLGGAQPCTFGKALQVIVTQVNPILQYEKTLQAGQWVPFPREPQIGVMPHLVIPQQTIQKGISESYQDYSMGMTLLAHRSITVYPWPGTHPAFFNLDENVLIISPTQQTY